MDWTQLTIKIFIAYLGDFCSFIFFGDTTLNIRAKAKERTESMLSDTFPHLPIETFDCCKQGFLI
jgi:hypothetical protein